MSLPANRRTCFVCGKPGHIAAACTSTERLCYNCGEPGHESSACPNPKVADNKQCYSCGGMGHVVAECPSIRVGSVSPSSSAALGRSNARADKVGTVLANPAVHSTPPAPSATTASSLATSRGPARMRRRSPPVLPQPVRSAFLRPPQ